MKFRLKQLGLPTLTAATMVVVSVGVAAWVWAARGPSPTIGPATLALGVGFVDTHGRLINRRVGPAADDSVLRGVPIDAVEVVVDVELWARFDEGGRLWWQYARIVRNTESPGRPHARGIASPGDRGRFAGTLPAATVRQIAESLQPRREHVQGANATAPDDDPSVTAIDTLIGFGMKRPQSVDWQRVLSAAAPPLGARRAGDWEGSWLNLPLWGTLIAESLFAGLLMGTATAGLMKLTSKLLRRRVQRYGCTTCGYDRAGLASTAPCPECGGGARTWPAHVDNAQGQAPQNKPHR